MAFEICFVTYYLVNFCKFASDTCKDYVIILFSVRCQVLFIFMNSMLIFHSFTSYFPAWSVSYKRDTLKCPSWLWICPFLLEALSIFVLCNLRHFKIFWVEYISLGLVLFPSEIFLLLLCGMHMCAKSLQLCLTLCDPIDCSPPGSSVHGILQLRILEWAAIPFSRGVSWPRDQTHISFVSCIDACSLPLVPPGKPIIL